MFMIKKNDTLTLSQACFVLLTSFFVTHSHAIFAMVFSANLIAQALDNIEVLYIFRCCELAPLLSGRHDVRY